MDVFEVLKRWADMARDATTVLNFLGLAASYVAVLVEHGKKVWTYVIGEKDKPEPLKPNVAFVIEITRPAVVSVKQYLDQQGIDANLVVIRSGKLAPDEELQPLDDKNPADWAEVVKSFRRQVEAIVQKSGVRQEFHVFISGPVALAFGLGSVLGTLYDIRVYNLARGGEVSYYPVLHLPKDVK